ncbi:ABC-2 type transport system permease protein [Paenibacillus sp. PastF-3]|uniref:ABC transporter permease n=1 Tax=Paenibacillus sp. PastF-3 TaxID=2940626 RepID=UPI0024771218|nr:ABC transporter permease [Paenibacillus sp. PastF-3]MDH6370998.1 ABC-2 type transport system permease protein [Paenibacillus sp. PastF-3]
MNTWTIMIYELRRLFSSRSMILNMFLLPLLLIFLLGASLSRVVGDNGPSTIDVVRVAVVNPSGEGYESSSMMDSLLKSSELKEIITPITVNSRDAAESGLRTGKYGYAVIVPPGFDSKVQSGGEAQLEFILGKKSTDNLVAGTVFDNFLRSLNYKQSVAMTLGPAAMNVMASSSTSNLPSVKLGELSEGGVSYTSSQFYAVSMMLMFLLYSGLTVCTSLFNEKENHTLFRINAMPVKGSELFIGKMLGVGVVSIVQCAAIIILTNVLFGVNWGNQPGLLFLFCLLMIVASMTLSIVISMFSKTGASARSIVTLLTVSMTFISGGMAPLPESWVNSIGAFTINHWAMQAILKMMLHADVSQIMPNLGVLSLICLVLFSAAAISYRKVGYHG